MNLFFIAMYFSLVAATLAAFHVFADLPYKRKKEQEAILKESSVQREGVWPPAPTTFIESPELDTWAWCMVCHRTSSLEAMSENSGFCHYNDCSAGTNEMVAWVDLRMSSPELPDQPEDGVVYANLIRVQETEPGTV